MGGLLNLLQYYIGRGGSTETPKMYYVIYEWPLNQKMKSELGDISDCPDENPNCIKAEDIQVACS